MFTLAISWLASFLGPVGLVFGILGGLLLDQAFLVWIWHRKLTKFLSEGIPLGWGNQLEARLLYLVWMHAFMDLGNPGSGVKSTDEWISMVKKVLGTLGRFPPVLNTSLEVMEQFGMQFRQSGIQAWKGCQKLGKQGNVWLFSLLRDTLFAEAGIESDYQDLWNMAVAAGLEARDFKSLMIEAPSLPKEFAQAHGLSRILPSGSDELRVMLGEGRIDAEAYSYIEGLLEVRNNLIDSFAEESMK